MKKTWLLILLVLLFTTSIASAGTRTYNFTVKNNTEINFESGYYIIQVIKINELPFYVKVNLSVSGESKEVNLYENEDYTINNEPFNKINIIAHNIYHDSADLEIMFPDEWGPPDIYPIKKKAKPTPPKPPKIPELIVTKSADKTELNIGDIVKIKIKIENIGNGTAKNMNLKEKLTSGFAIALDSDFPPDISNMIIEPGDKIDVPPYFLKPIESGTYTIEPTIIYYDNKTATSNSLTLNVLEKKIEHSNLTMKITLNKNNIVTGDTVKAMITIKNHGNVSAKTVVVEGKTPSGLEVMDGNLNKVYESIGPKETKKYEVTFKAMDTGSYKINLITKYNDNPSGFISSSENITITQNSKNYLYIILIVSILIIGIVAYTIKKHKEYSY